MIDGARMQSLSGYSVYDGWQVQGWPAFVLRRCEGHGSQAERYNQCEAANLKILHG